MSPYQVKEVQNQLREARLYSFTAGVIAGVFFMLIVFAAVNSLI